MFIHIGVPKTGTKSLQEMFRLHPGIEYLNCRAFNRAFAEITCGDSCIYSQENISLLPNSHFEDIRRNFDGVEIIMFTRDPVSILPSLYARDGSFYLKINRHFTWPEWLDLVLTIDNPVRRMLHYGRRIEAIRKYFTVHVFRYEDLSLHHDRLITDLAKVLGIDAGLAVQIMRGLWLNKSGTKPVMTEAQRDRIREEFG